MNWFSMGRGLASLGLLIALNPSVWAQAPQPGADSPYEYQVVSTASRKMLEVQRETDLCVLDAIPRFLRFAAPVYRTQAPLMYGAMEAAGKKLKGRGPRCASMFRTLYHVTSATSFYKYNVSDDWKKKKAESLSQPGKPVDWQSSEVFAAWEDAVTDGKDVPAGMLLPDSVAMPALSWLTPDERVHVPGAATREDGTDKFFKLCHLLSLAPEWYSDGFVNMNYPALGAALIRPVSFDGMLSPLWVQHAPDKEAATGGGAVEVFNEKPVRVSGLGSMQAYIVSKGMSETLRKSPSVNDYSADLNKVAQGTDAFAPRLGKEQTEIVREVRAARSEADAEFAGVPAASIPVASGERCSRRTVRADLALPSGRGDYASLDALAHEMTVWAANGLVENRAQRFPAERFEREAAQSQQAAQAIIVAATALLRQSDDPAVLAMVGQLGIETAYRSYYVALLDRLNGQPTALPEGPGIRSLTVKGDLMMRLEDRLPAQDQTLAPRAAALSRAARERLAER